MGLPLGLNPEFLTRHGTEMRKESRVEPGGSHMHHTSRNHLANAEKKKLILCHVNPTCLSHLSLPENPESSKSRVAVWGLIRDSYLVARLQLGLVVCLKNNIEESGL